MLACKSIFAPYPRGRAFCDLQNSDSMRRKNLDFARSLYYADYRNFYVCQIATDFYNKSAVLQSKSGYFRLFKDVVVIALNQNRSTLICSHSHSSGLFCEFSTI